jgi:predicted RNA-binding Zn ribbon-like protein
MARTSTAAAFTRWSRWAVALVEAGEGRPLCLALTNTRHFRNSAAPRENLHEYSDLIDWALLGKIVGKKEAARLAALATAGPAAARRELARVITLREAMARMFAAKAHRHASATDDLAVIMATFNEAAKHLKLAIDNERIVPCVDDAEAGLALPRWQVALSAIGLFSSEAAGRVKECADDRGCGWLFVDTTRNGSRMYCFSNECGNRARQMKFRARHRAGDGPVHAHGD